ncbi:hypothetical protein [Priestia megaterium]|uniref:hypothetical protein n=1 Tax=Priestia megaterium TaxID=1404 RepID=UPI00207AE1AC|nr:hypothetical protein [Priestia megaterium]USL25090.1 hypothetical protein LIT33_02255 [Priestia megaterium]
MKLMSVLSGKGFVMYNKQLAKTVSVNAAIIFGQLCASYESFNGKGMLTIKDKKEYFFLTSETLQEETALTYKQQLKAVKDLEQAGYIETKIMGVPSKKYFYITDKIVQELFNEVNSSSDKKEDLENTSNQEAVVQKVTPRYDQTENLVMLKEKGKPVQKGSSIKEKNKKEKDKNNNINYNCNFKKPLEPAEFRELLSDACNEFYSEFTIGRWSKKQWNILIGKFVNDTIESGRYLKVPQENIRGFAFKCIEKICNNSDYKHSEEFADYQEVMKDLSHAKINSYPSDKLYNWLEDDNLIY